jgi:hypothetical protein
LALRIRVSMSANMSVIMAKALSSQPSPISLSVRLRADS